MIDGWNGARSARTGPSHGSSAHDRPNGMRPTGASTPRGIDERLEIPGEALTGLQRSLDQHPLSLAGDHRLRGRRAIPILEQPREESPR